MLLSKQIQMVNAFSLWPTHSRRQAEDIAFVLISQGGEKWSLSEIDCRPNHVLIKLVSVSVYNWDQRQQMKRFESYKNKNKYLNNPLYDMRAVFAGVVKWHFSLAVCKWFLQYAMGIVNKACSVFRDSSNMHALTTKATDKTADEKFLPIEEL